MTDPAHTVIKILTALFCDSLTNIRFDQHSELQTRIIGLLNILQSSNSQKYKDQYRFFALGIDAYHLQLFKHRLDIIPSVGISGASGHLTLDGNKLNASFIGTIPKWQNHQLYS